MLKHSVIVTHNLFPSEGRVEPDTKLLFECRNEAFETGVYILSLAQGVIYHSNNGGEKGK